MLQIMPGPLPKILRIKQPQFPQFRFEYHPAIQKVYLIRLMHQPALGDPIAEHVPDHGSAINAVNTWLRGYREGRGLLNIRPDTAPKE